MRKYLQRKEGFIAVLEALEGEKLLLPLLFFSFVTLEKKPRLSPEQFCSEEFNTEKVIFHFATGLQVV